MDHQAQHGHGTTGADGYGNPVAGQGVDTTGVVGHGAGPGGAPPAETENRSRGILHRSGSSSSSSSSEDDGMGGRRKKGIKEKIKEKLPGGHKDDTQNQQAAASGTTGAYGQQGRAAATNTTTGGTGGTHGVDAINGEKKGLMDKIKEKLPGHH